MQKKEKGFDEELTDIVRKRFLESDVRLVFASIHGNDFIKTNAGLLDESDFIKSLSKTMFNVFCICTVEDEQVDLSDSITSFLFCSILAKDIDFSTLAKEHLSQMYESYSCSIL